MSVDRDLSVKPQTTKRFVGSAGPVIFAVLLSCPALWAEERRPVTKEEVLARLRTDAEKRHEVTEFRILEEIVPTEKTRAVAERAKKDQESRGIKSFDDDLRISFLRSGGFGIVEYDPKTRQALRWHLATRKETELFFESDRIEFGGPERLGLTVEEMTELAPVAKKFVLDSFTSPYESAKALCPERIPPKFEIRKSFEGLSDDQVDEAMRALKNIDSSPMPNLLSRPIFAVSPALALEDLGPALDSTLKQFARENGLHLENDKGLLEWLVTGDRYNVAQRFEALKKLDKYLRRQLLDQIDPDVYEANRAIATLPHVFDTRKGDDGKKNYEVASLLFWTLWERRAEGFCLVLYIFPNR